MSHLPMVLREGASDADISDAWFELFTLMPSAREALERQKAETMEVCLRTWLKEDWDRYTRMCQLVWQAMHMMNAEDL
jgi:hypothetical protein